MSLTEQISNDMKEAMKAKNDATLSTLRLLRSALKNRQIDLMHELSDAEAQDVIKSQVKQLKDAIDLFVAGGRFEAVESNQKEIDLLKKYLPAELSDLELEGIVKEAVTASGVASKSEIGKAMGFVMKAVAGRADGTRVKSIVESLLGVFVLVVFGFFTASEQAHAAISFVGIPTMETILLFPFVEFSLRLIRILLLFTGLFCLNGILHSSFKMSTTGNDNELHHAEHSILHGFIGITITVSLFFVTSMMLGKIV